MSRGAEITGRGDPVVLAKDALARGDFLEAYDIAMSANGGEPGHSHLSYCAVLALARMGDIQMALDLYERMGLDDSDDDDMRALRGRLMKDLAERAPANEQAELFAKASAAYRVVYESKGGYFPAINAATTALLSGDTAVAEKLAREILADPEIGKPTNYYAAATAAEANILLDQPDEAFEAIRAAIGWSDASVGSRVSTFRQMKLIGDLVPDKAEGIAPLLEALRPAPVVFYTGHMFVEDADAEAELAERISAALDEIRPDAAYGALACGADIIIAEAILKRGLELHVVFPFSVSEFVTQSVNPGGPGWLRRFEYCMARATHVSFATDGTFVGDPGMFRYGSCVAMGLARMRARHLRTDAIQLAVLESNDGINPAGTAADVEMWRELGHDVRILDPGSVDRNLDYPETMTMPDTVERVAHSMIFADFAGFSTLPESVLPVFTEEVLGKIGEVLDRFEDSVLYRNSWGDALYAVIATPMDAAEIVLQLQRHLAEMPQALLDCDENCGMRIGVHHGPIYRAHDAVMKRDSFFGTEVTRTARIEPVTPTGEVYATEAFAAILSLEPERKYATHYVGKIQLAKGYGELAMHKLSRFDRVSDAG